MYTAFLSLGHLAFSKLNCIVSSGKISIYASTSSSFHPEEESAAMLKSTTFLSPEPHGFFSAHAISEIVTQTDVRIKKRVRTRDFTGFGASKPGKKHGSVLTHPPKHGTDCLYGQKCEVRTSFLTSPYPIFLPCKRPLMIQEGFNFVHYLCSSAHHVVSLLVPPPTV